MKNRLRQFLSGELIQNLNWLFGSELFIRLSRLLVAIVLARLLSATEYGAVALAVTIHEFVMVFRRNGIGLKVVQTGDAELQNNANTAYWMNWVLAVILFAVQCLLAYPMAVYFQTPELAGMLVFLALTYLIYPFSNVQVYLTQREKRLGVYARANAWQMTADNLICVGLALMGFGVWSVVIPKMFSSPLWVWHFRKHQPWRPQKGLSWRERFQGWREMLAFSKHVLGTELLKTARLNIDKLLIGRLLGVDVLGLYYFAVNAGMGISMMVVNAFNMALYPQLCEVKDKAQAFRRTYFHGLRLISVLAPTIMITQAVLAPWYVPLIFGEKWIPAIPVLIILTLSAIPRPYAEIASALLRSLDLPQVDLRWNLIFTGLFIAAILLGIQWQLIGVAWAVFLIHLLAIPIYLIWVQKRYVPAAEVSQ